MRRSHSVRTGGAGDPRRDVRFRSVLAPLGLGLALLAGCTAEDGGADGGADATPDAGEGTEATPTPAPTATGSVGEGPDCLEGEWVADLDATREMKLSAPGISEFQPKVDVSGESRVTFDGSTMTTVYDDQVTELTLDMDGSDIVVTATLDGTVTGSYTATGTELTVSDVDLDELTVESSATVGGQETDPPDLQDAELAGVDLTGVSDYTCDEDRLEITPQDEMAEGVTLVLTRG